MSDIEYFALLLPIGIFVISWIIRGKRKEDEEEYYREMALNVAHRVERYSDITNWYDGISKQLTKATIDKIQKSRCLYCATPYEDEDVSCTKCGAPA